MSSSKKANKQALEEARAMKMSILRAKKPPNYVPTPFIDPVIRSQSKPLTKTKQTTQSKEPEDRKSRTTRLSSYSSARSSRSRSPASREQSPQPGPSRREENDAGILRAVQNGTY